MRLPVIIVGGGGHAKVLLDAVQAMGIPVAGITDVDCHKQGQEILGIKIIGDDEELKKYPVDQCRLVNGIGSTGDSTARRCVFQHFQNAGYVFESVIHPSAVVARNVMFEQGIQIMAGAVIQTGCRFGRNVIVNSGTTIDHDCQIGDHSHVAPGAILCGGVVVGERSHIGAGATLIQGVSVGRNCIVAAGAVVVRNVADGLTVAGVPAAERKQ